MSILVIIFPLILGVAAVIYFGGPSTRGALWGVTACSVLSLTVILAIYHLAVLKPLLNHPRIIVPMEGLFFAFLFSTPFTLVGWAQEARGLFRRKDSLR